ncbi:hypothetical protein FE257_009920 [Aspergillus nanangensis]|uniref:LysM domain-containing protein n=1 Tax=Aspergillus nanangensis TaxID=2582783 RepID=A0AAD4CW17_ASPNN|nr:hypothetical protein FE257_009920 [Aspergillus nanangensis]
MPSEWGISMEDFFHWNPSITADCGNFLTGQSYCVEAPVGGTGPAPSTTATTGPSPTGGNGVETPLPTQPSMVSNCDEFYYVEVGDTCPEITAKYGITTAQFIKWNASVGADCTGLWASYYMCVSVIGQSPGTTTTTTSTPPDPTTPPNGIETPLPIQSGMVDICDAFHLVQAGDTCDTIAAKYKISTTQFVAWNPAVGSTCSGMWANTYACVSIIGHNPSSTSTTTTSASGPSPTQSGLISICETFYKAQQGDT